jgi:hypothetical protein
MRLKLRTLLYFRIIVFGTDRPRHVCITGLCLSSCMSKFFNLAEETSLKKTV